MVSNNNNYWHWSNQSNVDSQKAAQKAAQKEVQKIIKFIDSYKPCGSYSKELLDALRALRAKINEIDPPPAAIAAGGEGQDNQEAKISKKQESGVQKILAAATREKEKAAWEKWRDASKAYEQAKRDYDYWKKAEEYFEASIWPLNEPFRQATELLSYFVPCRTTADYEKRATVLLNKQRYLCGSLRPGRWGECLTSDRLSQLRCPDDEPPQVEMDTIPFESSERPLDAIESYEAKTKELIEETSDYRHDLERMENARLQHRNLWEYAWLLRDFLPAIELLQQFEDAEDRAALAVKIGSKLTDAVENHRCLDPKIHFRWLFPDDDAYRESLSIRLDFSLAEATCPGLYYTLGAGTPICVIHGHVVEKE